MSRIRFLIFIFIAISSLVGILLGTLGIAILFAVDLPGINSLSPNERITFAVWCFVALLISWILFFIERETTVRELRVKLSRQRDLQAALDGLSALRSEGVNSLYAGTPSKDEFDDWVDKFHDWENRVVDYMKPRFTGAIVGLLSELGPIPVINFSHASTDPAITEKHQFFLRMLTKELRILERIIQQSTLLVQEPNPTIWELIWQRNQSV